jgi:hypothetical protein
MLSLLPKVELLILNNMNEFVKLRNTINCELPAHAGLGGLVVFGVDSMSDHSYILQKIRFSDLLILQLQAFTNNKTEQYRI